MPFIKSWNPSARAKLAGAPVTADLTGLQEGQYKVVSGDVMAEGRAENLVLVATGSGDADLESLSVSDARVSLSGSGDARIAPTRAADLTSSGSGDIDLATRPATLRQSTTGSGSVRQD